MSKLKTNELNIIPKFINNKATVFSLDLEGDYNGSEKIGLKSLEKLLQILEVLNIPLTVYVEGRLFSEFSIICELLTKYKADIQLHCFDHTKGGDSTHDLKKSVIAYEKFMGCRPLGYRAFRYELYKELYYELIEQGFAWDSSVLPAYALGGNPSWRLIPADYYILDDKILEFPIATWKTINYPITQSYRGILKKPLEKSIDFLFKKPNHLIYVSHMVDLVWTKNLWTSPLNLFLKFLYLYYWGFSRTDKFKELINYLNSLKKQKYEFVTSNDIYNDYLKNKL